MAPKRLQDVSHSQVFLVLKQVLQVPATAAQRGLTAPVAHGAQVVLAYRTH